MAAAALQEGRGRGRGARRARGRRRRRARAPGRRRGRAGPADRRRTGGRHGAPAPPARRRQREDRDRPAAGPLLGAAARARRRRGRRGADRRPRRGEGAARLGGQVDGRVLHDVPRQPVLEVHRALGRAAWLDAELRHLPLDARRRARRARVRHGRPVGARARRRPAAGRVHARLRRRPARPLHAHVHAARRLAGLDLRPRQGVRRLRRPRGRRRATTCGCWPPPRSPSRRCATPATSPSTPRATRRSRRGSRCRSASATRTIPCCAVRARRPEAVGAQGVRAADRRAVRADLAHRRVLRRPRTFVALLAWGGLALAWTTLGRLRARSAAAARPP